MDLRLTHPHQSQAKWEAVGTLPYGWGPEAAQPAQLQAAGDIRRSGRGQGLRQGMVEGRATRDHGWPPSASGYLPVSSCLL